MAKLEKLLGFKTLMIDADLVSNIWYRKGYRFGKEKRSNFCRNIIRRITGLPPKKENYHLAKWEYSFFFPATVYVQLVGDKKPLEIECKSNKQAKELKETYTDWVNERKTKGCNYVEKDALVS